MIAWVITLAMGEKNVNIEIDAALWQRVKARAVEIERPVKAVVANALRLLLASPVGGSVAAVTVEQPPAAERGAELSLHGIPAAVEEDPFGGVSAAQPRQTKDQLQALVDGVLAKDAGVLLPHQELARATVTDPAYVSARDQERQRRAAQDRLRMHPEDAPQADPEVDF